MPDPERERGGRQREIQPAQAQGRQCDHRADHSRRDDRDDVRHDTGSARRSMADVMKEHGPADARERHRREAHLTGVADEQHE